MPVHQLILQRKPSHDKRAATFVHPHFPPHPNPLPQGRGNKSPFCPRDEMFFPSPLREKPALSACPERSRRGGRRPDEGGQCLYINLSCKENRLMINEQQRSYIHIFPLTLTLSLKGEGFLSRRPDEGVCLIESTTLPILLPMN